MATAPHDAALSFEALTAPLPDGDPCGPDLDADGDAAYMNFMAAGEGLLPATFYERDARDPERDGQPFDRTKIDFAAQYAKIATLERQDVCDVRLIALLGEVPHSRQGSVRITCARRSKLSRLFLEKYWETVHPRTAEGDFLLRMVAVQSLDDMAPVVLPLIYAPLFEHKRFGAVTYRMHLLAVGEVAPRDGEDKPDATLVRRAFAEDVDFDVLVERRDWLQSLGLALARIRAAFIEHVGIVEAVDFQRLAPLVESMRALLDGYVVLRNPLAGDAVPAAVESEGEAPASSGSGSSEIAHFADAAAALRGVAAYYLRFEPSNPALLLVRQAEQLIGKSFLDAIRVLVPGHVEAAAVQIGRAHVFDLPIERLSEFASVEDVAAPDENIAPSFEVTTRDNALQLLAKVSAFYHQAEPSGSGSFLTDRARYDRARFSRPSKRYAAARHAEIPR